MSADIDFLTTDQRVALGSRPNIALLKERGFTHVVNLAGGLDQSAAVATYGLKQLWINWTDAHTTQLHLTEDLLHIVSYINHTLSENGGNKILIHCEAGIERTPLAAYTWLRTQGKSDLQARKALKEARPEVLFSFIDGNSYAVESFIYAYLHPEDASAR